jgi:hypothetical protein
VTKPPKPTPPSTSTTTDDIDDLWAEVDFGPSPAGKAAKAPPDPFGLEASQAEAEPAGDNEPEPAAIDFEAPPSSNLGSVDETERVDSDPFAPRLGADLDFDARLDPPPVARPPSAQPSYRPGAQTAPEPVVQRHVEQMEARSDVKLDLSLSDPEEAASFGIGGSAMELVEHGLPPDAAAFEEAGRDATGGSTSDLQDRYAVGDFTGALVIAESILETDPDDEDALRYAASCREVLTQMYSARLGPLDQVAQVAVPPDQITWLSLDHRAGFLLSLVDGASTLEEILDISGMTRLEALRIMYTLVQQNVVSVA